MNTGRDRPPVPLSLEPLGVGLLVVGMIFRSEFVVVVSLVVFATNAALRIFSRR